MKCDKCEKEITSAKILMGVGMFCEDCVDIASEEHKKEQDKLFAELRAEKPGDIPDEVDFRTFERFFLRYALHFLDGLKPEEREKIRKNNPLMLWPEQLCLHLKEQVVHLIPEQYVHVQDAHGHERMFSGGTFELHQPIPHDVFVGCLEEAKLIKKRRKGGGHRRRKGGAS